MTGLPNARSLQMQFEKEVARASRSGSSFQVLMLDLDGFKAVNDTFGHKVGDMMLKGVASVMTQELRDYDFLARYAGDEFVAIVPETDEDAVRELCDRIEKAVVGFKLPVGEDKFACVGVSLGAASYPQNGKNFDQVVVAADKAMYVVKGIRKQRRVKDSEKDNSFIQSSINPTIIETRIIPPPAAKYRNIEMPATPEILDEGFIVELDESHIVSSAIN
jgi:diguanylate cyclase (GGDEF)-like protein